MKQEEIIFALPVLEAAQKLGGYSNLKADIQMFKKKNRKRNKT